MSLFRRAFRLESRRGGIISSASQTPGPDARDPIDVLNDSALLGRDRPQPRAGAGTSRWDFEWHGGVRRALAFCWHVVVFAVSFCIFRVLRFGMRHLGAGQRRRMAGRDGTPRWRGFSELATEPLRFAYFMLCAPRWNCHFLLGWVGDFRVERHLQVDLDQARRSADVWTVVVHDLRGRPVASIGSGSEHARGRLELPPGYYCIVVRYYGVHGSPVLPSVVVDDALRIESRDISGEPAAYSRFLRRLQHRRPRILRLFHAHLHHLVAWERRLPNWITRGAYIGMPDSDTQFLVGAIRKGEAVRTVCSRAVLDQYRVYVSIYNQASLPVSWERIHESDHTSGAAAGRGVYCVRIVGPDAIRIEKPEERVFTETVPFAEPSLLESRDSLPLAETPLAGVTLANWRRIVREFGPVDARSVCRKRAALVTLSSLAQWPWQGLESLLTRRKVRSTEVTRHPVFVIGYYRSGTTHLQRLLATDPQFGFFDSVDCFAPSTSLVRRGLAERLVNLGLPPTRGHDHVTLSSELPEEDEYALSNLTAFGVYHATFFPRRWRTILERNALLDGLTAAELARWKAAYREIVQKVTLRGGGKRLLSKNPANTGRVEHLLELFPRARFIYIHRDPQSLYPSLENFYRTEIGNSGLQDISLAELRDSIFESYRRVTERYLEFEDRIPEGQRAEVRFEDLERDPIGEIRRLYRDLDLSEDPEMESRLNTYLESVRGYRKNEYRLKDGVRDRIEREWAFVRERWPQGNLEVRRAV